MVDALVPRLPGHRIVRVRVRRADVAVPSGAALVRALQGARIQSVRRRAKNILIETDRPLILRVHLGMTGQLLYFRGQAGRPGHTAVSLVLDGDATLVYSDVRRFGRVEALSSSEWRDRESELGPEPLDPSLTPDLLSDRLARSESPIRSWLLDPRQIAGIGNIYATEALHAAGIHPRRPASSLDAPEVALLLTSLRASLRLGIDSGGTTLRDYRNIDGQQGENAKNLRAYGREGSACKRCGTPIERLTFGGRSAFLCPSCQPVQR